jgi:hypothetical protein
MSWTLGSITLPAPQGFERRQIEVQTEVQTLSGSTRRDTTTKKEQYVLYFEKLTQTEVTQILTEYNKNLAVAFAVSETNLTIQTTQVLISLKTRQYLTPGDEYREDFELTLTEVT